MVRAKTLEELDKPLKERPNKTQLKREAALCLALAEKLCKLPEKQLDQLPIPSDIAEHIKEIQGFASREARRRKLKLVTSMINNSTEREELLKIDFGKKITKTRW